MAEQPSAISNILKKGTVGVLVGAGFFGLAYALGFPLVYRIMFFAYALLGAVVFILLDAPPMGRVEGVKAVIALVVFYLVLSGVFIGGASLWPQYDPEIEKAKIGKILERRIILFESGKPAVLLKRAQALSEKAEAILARLDAAGVDKVVDDGGPPTSVKPKVAADALATLGLEQWNLQECYHCHVLSIGETSTKKKRGPTLDNIGNVMTVEQIEEKILNPKTWMAEGYEKQYKKGTMPNKYKDLMFEDEVDALAAFLVTRKNPNANTPKAINKK